MSSHEHEMDEGDLLKWPEPLPPHWSTHRIAPPAGAEQSFQVLEHAEPRGRIDVRHVVASRITEAYPVGHRDRLLELHPGVTAEAVQLVAEAVMRADPRCRRLVLAVREGDIDTIALAERAGFRYVVDVDLRDAAYSLLAAEPAWVLEESRHIDDVPTH